MSRYPSLRWPLLRVAVRGPSMVPALRDGDWLVASRARRVRPGRIVLAEDPERPGFPLVKRAERWEGTGWWLSSDFADAPGARDSRAFGPVPPDKITGVVLARYHPDPKIL